LGKDLDVKKSVCRLVRRALGNLNNNRMIERLYFNKYLAIDGLFPGPGRYVLQTVHEPYNGPLGKNVVVIGASDAAGLAAGVDEFIRRLPAAVDGSLALAEPLVYASGVKQLTGAARRKLLAKAIGHHALREFWEASRRYRDSGDLAWAERAKKILLYCGERFIKDPD